MQPDDKSLNVVLLSRFFDSCSSEKKKGGISTSAIDKFLQITKSDVAACCSTDEISESPSLFSSSATAVAATETPFSPSDINCSSKESPPSP